MEHTAINPKLVAPALEHVGTADFERFRQAFYGAIVGRSFVPLGGVHDGGAEGYLDPDLFEDNQGRSFLQISKQKTYEAKIRNTVKRLLEYGRKPSALCYISSLIIRDIDKLEDELSNTLNCRITIRDRKYIETHINRNTETTTAFNAYLYPHVNYLESPGAAKIASRADKHVDRTLAVFLRQEVEYRSGRTDLLEAVADSLIIWALTDTDPAKGQFMERAEILKRIETTLPSARQFIRGVLDARLRVLRTKTGHEERKIRFYAKAGHYCLPHDTRQLVTRENIEDESLYLLVSEIFEKRCLEFLKPEDENLIESIVMICHETLQRLFENQGLMVAQFVSNGDLDDELYSNAASYLAQSIDAHPEIKGNLETIRQLSTKVLRGTFYDGTETERVYLRKLSKTYVLMLTLRNEPKIVQYFKKLSSHFVLYIGTDFLVRALSEHYLDEDNQITRNLFAMLKAAGARLILTEKAVEELATHLRAQIFEFETVYSHVDRAFDVDLVECVDRILIRSYFYARLLPIKGIKPPAGFKSYIENFASYTDIKADKGDKELAHYLISKFHFEYETAEDMQKGVDMGKVKTLTDAILAVRSERGVKNLNAKVLAENDALQVFTIYAKRRQNNEGNPQNPFGYKTWWLTQDGKVQRASAYVVSEHNGERFLIRPEFLTNFISFAPSEAQVEASYKVIFPSVLGIRLSNRVADFTFRDIVKKANDVWSVDQERAKAMIATLTDKLKGDTMKIYDVKY